MQRLLPLLTLALALPLAAEPVPPPRVTVDATCPGYGTEVLTDGKWVEVGKEITQVYGHRDALGNSGNSWVSAPAEGEHWVRLDWPQAVTLNQISLWWVQQAWWPRAVRVEMLSDTNWVSLTGPGDWLKPTAQHSLITFPQVTTRTIRLLQHPRGGEPDRGFLALQEVTAQMVADAKPGLEGVRKLTAEEKKELEPVVLERNIARLGERQPEASRAVIWEARGPHHDQPELADGRLEAVPGRLLAGDAPGVIWATPHAIDGVALFFAGAVPEGRCQVRVLGAGPRLQPVRSQLTVQSDLRRHCLTIGFEPAVAHAIACDLPANAPMPVEVEVYRYTPPAPNVWPERLTNGAYERELLASHEEPSFERLSTAALSMTPARALLGLKDDKREVGVTWDGDVLSNYPLRFSFGDKRERFSDYRETVMRQLWDDWRPMAVVSGRVGDLSVEQHTRVSFPTGAAEMPVLVTDLFAKGADGGAVVTTVSVTIEARGQPLTLRNNMVLAGEQPVLVWEPVFHGELDGTTVTFTINGSPDGQIPARIEFVQPLTTTTAEGLPWEKARSAAWMFTGYWDRTLQGGATVAVPEPRINNLYRAVLTQLFINADGDIMPYGSAPSVYDGNLYGVEEGFAMMALAQSGFAADAERYMDHTYLTPDFLVKVPEYKEYEDRHQQYRNGLQPWYAIRLYKLTRNRPWIEKHVPMFKGCAEWTIAQRRTTMVEENGVKPLHWGLLPKWSYGGDISELQCYALYANFCCWKGLADTAWLLDDLGDKATATRYRQEAADYRTCIDRAVEGNLLRDRQPPFLPLQLYAKAPVGDDYDQLFVGCLLDLQALEPGGRQERYLTDWMEADNRTFCLLPRFRRDVGPGGLDGLYGLGYIQSKLQQDKVNEFLLGFYAYLAFNMDHNTFASRETNLIYASDLHVRSKYKVPDMSDPVPCSSAVALLLLRDMLVMEAPAKWGEPNTELRLLYGTPKAWFEQGKTIRCENMPTEFGPVSVMVEAARGSVRATIRPPTRNPWQRLVIRLRHPEGRRWRRVLVNGKPWTGADAARELVTLQPGPETFSIKVEY